MLRDLLDALLTEEEIKTVIFQMLKKKSPGLDGIPIEFYQIFWEEIKHLYMDYLRKVKIEAFSETKNTSVIGKVEGSLQ